MPKKEIKKTNKKEQTIKEITKQVIEEVKKPLNKTTKQDIEFLKSGITLLDLCLGGGFGKGYISNICGWESTGKTVLACEILGNNKRKNKSFDHRFNNSESGFTLNTDHLFGFKINMVDPSSDTVEKFVFDVEKTMKKKNPDKDMIYVLDSLDGLSDSRELKKHKEDMNKVKEALDKDKEAEIKGDYSGKAKALSEFFRLNNKDLLNSKMHLMITSQLRDKVGVIYGKKEGRTGGKALQFYCAQIIWLYLEEKLTKKVTVDGKNYERNTSNFVRAEIEKNKLGPGYRNCYFFIDMNYGIDNIKSNIYFLYDLITPKGELRDCKEFVWDDRKFNSDEKLIKYIEDNNLESELEKRVTILWEKIESALLVDRKKKF